MAVKTKYGTEFKWGTGWKYGYGTSEPWIPSAGANRFTIESLLDPPADFIRDFSTLWYVNAQGVLTNRYGSYPDEVFYLLSPNGTSWRITANGMTGAVTVVDGFSGTPLGIQLVNEVGVIFTMSISNGGILSVTDQAGFTIESSFVPTYTVEVP